MRFIQEYDGTWYQIDDKKHRLYNYNHGWKPYNPGLESYFQVNAKEYDSWHELYMKENYNPIAGNYKSKCAWVAPNGDIWEGVAHSLAADKICDIYYGKDIDNSEDYLINNGWIKITTSLMHDYYVEQGLYDYCTEAQLLALIPWCNYYGVNFNDFSYNFRKSSKK